MTVYFDQFAPFLSAEERPFIFDLVLDQLSTLVLDSHVGFVPWTVAVNSEFYSQTWAATNNYTACLMEIIFRPRNVSSKKPKNVAQLYYLFAPAGLIYISSDTGASA